MKIEVEYFLGFSKGEEYVAREGLKLLENAICSQEFKEMVLEHKFKNTNKTNEEIYNRLVSGSDDMDERKDGIIQLNFSMYSRWWSKVIGWVTPGTRLIHVNRKYFGNPKEFASNVIHEYAHMIGFDHANARDYSSVPYSMNSIFDKWCLRNNI